MTPDEYLERVRALLPALRERVVQAERLRRLPEETFKDIPAVGSRLRGGRRPRPRAQQLRRDDAPGARRRPIR